MQLKNFRILPQEVNTLRNKHNQNKAIKAT